MTTSVTRLRRSQSFAPICFLMLSSRKHLLPCPEHGDLEEREGEGREDRRDVEVEPVRLTPPRTRMRPAELKKAWAMMVLATRTKSTRRVAFERKKASSRSSAVRRTRVRAITSPAVIAEPSRRASPPSVNSSRACRLFVNVATQYPHSLRYIPIRHRRRDVTEVLWRRDECERRCHQRSTRLATLPAPPFSDPPTQVAID